MLFLGFLDNSKMSYMGTEGGGGGQEPIFDFCFDFKTLFAIFGIDEKCQNHARM
jgi:hypothetical protein